MYFDLCSLKFIYLLLSSLFLASSSGSKVDDKKKSDLKNGNEKVTFNDLPHDMIRLITTFIEPEDIFNLRYVNCKTLSSLHLKKLVEEIFKISGLESIADNEPELAGVLKLAHISHELFIFFKALMKDVVEGENPYNVLFVPLILHLFQIFPGLDLQEQQDYQQYFNRKFNEDVESYMIKAHFLKIYFDLVLKKFGNDADLSDMALEYAAQLDLTGIVKLFLQSRTDISTYDTVLALLNASIKGDTSVVELLLQSRTNIHAYYCGWALCNASENGHASIVELLLQSRTDICADHVGWALRHASKKGHASIVELLQSRTNISVYDVVVALLNASIKGHTPIVELIIGHLKNIVANYFAAFFVIIGIFFFQSHNFDI